MEYSLKGWILSLLFYDHLKQLLSAAMLWKPPRPHQLATFLSLPPMPPRPVDCLVYFLDLTEIYFIGGD